MCTIKIVPNDKGNPPGKLADAELHFTDGSLAGVDFSAADLHGLNLSQAVIPDGIFRGADLRQTDLSGADLRNCNFEMADIRGWRVAHAVLAGADFSGARRE